MRVLSPLNRDKSALSNMVGYVLLIGITISLSVLVYAWLRFYVQGEDIDECSEDVNIIIRSYQCYLPNEEGEGGRFIVTLKNKGLFTVDGYRLRVHDRENASFGIYLFDDEGFAMKPGEEVTWTYYFNDTDASGDSKFKNLNPGENFLKTVTLIEVQPFIEENGEISCQSHAFQKVECKH